MSNLVDAVVDANQSIDEDPVGGYCAFTCYPRHGLQVCLDGDFDIEDIKRILALMETIAEDLLK